MAELVKDNLLKSIRKFVKGGTFEFNGAYLRKTGGVLVGEHKRPCYRVTRKCLHFDGRVEYGTNAEGEYGARLLKHDIYRADRQTNKVALDDMFADDLLTLLTEIKYSIWWVSCVHFAHVEKEYKDLKEYCDKYVKLLVDNENESSSIKL